MIPICLITGFLGSGKTTYLEYLSKEYRWKKIAYVVNEFSKYDVDGERIRDAGIEAISLPGGSIFCKCLVADFIKTLKQIPDLFVSAKAVEGVIVETSGMADPRVAGIMLNETGLDIIYRITSVVAVVDPGNFFKLVKVLPAISSQITSSDIVILNKIDIYENAVIEKSINAIKEINTSVHIVKTSFGKVDYDVFRYDSNIINISGSYAPCKDPNYESIALTLTDNVDINDLQISLISISDLIYRAKGYVNNTQGSLYIDYSGSGYSIETIYGKSHSSSLALIVKSGMTEEVRKALDTFIIS